MVTDTDVETPSLYTTTISHNRIHPLRHEFRYRHPMWLVDLGELSMNRLPRMLAGAVRFESRDHLGNPTHSIRENVVSWVAARGLDVRADRIVMLANGRSFGHAFNPLTVFWCLRPDGSVHCVVAEVHNTYGGRHCYLLEPDAKGRAQAEKAFYVSPFNDATGEYDMRFSRPAQNVRVDVVLRRDGRTIFSATLVGCRRPASGANVAKSVVRYPAAALRVSALIRYQGIRLFLRRLPVVRRPTESGNATPLPRRGR
ncbi:MAG: DUF1365 domain-containing protein [Acidothermaceae bacterium]